MLIPRAGLSIALLFAFSNPPAFAIASVNLRDQTFFRQDGSLTDYAHGVLYANAAWTGWRILVLIASWSVAVNCFIALPIDFFNLGLDFGSCPDNVWLDFVVLDTHGKNRTKKNPVPSTLKPYLNVVPTALASITTVMLWIIPAMNWLGNGVKLLI